MVGLRRLRLLDPPYNSHPVYDDWMDALDVLYEDNHCLAIAKPAGVPSTHFDGRRGNASTGR